VCTAKKPKLDTKKAGLEKKTDSDEEQFENIRLHGYFTFD